MAESEDSRLAETDAFTMSAMTPDLDVVIVTYNSVHVIGELLDSLPAALDGLTCDVVVVDNGSADGTAEFVAARGGCRVIRSPNVGYAVVLTEACAKRCPRTRS